MLLSGQMKAFLGRVKWDSVFTVAFASVELFYNVIRLIYLFSFC